MCVGTLGLKTPRRLKVPTEAQTQRERMYPERKRESVPREKECTQRERMYPERERMYPERENVPREKECTDTHSIIGVGTGGAGQAMA